MKKPLKKSLIVMMVACLWWGMVDAKTLSQAVNQVKKDTGGRVLSAKTQVQGSREVHVIKVVTKDGKVKTVRVQGNPVKKKRPNQ